MRVPALLIAEVATGSGAKSTFKLPGRPLKITNNKASSIMSAITYSLANKDANASRQSSLVLPPGRDVSSSSCMPSASSSALSTSTGALAPYSTAALQLGSPSASIGLPTATLGLPQLLPTRAEVSEASMTSASQRQNPASVSRSLPAASTMLSQLIPLSTSTVAAGRDVTPAAWIQSLSASSYIPSASVMPPQLRPVSAGASSPLGAGKGSSRPTLTAGSISTAMSMQESAAMRAPAATSAASTMTPGNGSSSSIVSLTAPWQGVISTASPQASSTVALSTAAVGSGSSDAMPAIPQRGLAPRPAGGPRPQNSAPRLQAGLDYDHNISSYMYRMIPQNQLRPHYMSYGDGTPRTAAVPFRGAQSLPVANGTPALAFQQQVSRLPKACKQ